MIEQAGPTIIGNNQVTQVVDPALNIKGMILKSFYTQVIQMGAPGNSVQTLLVASETAPTNFAGKLKCFPVFRTYQNDKQDPVTLAGYAPMNVCNISFPANWGIWQICTVVGSALDRNNMRLGIVIL
jgi:hypothetical protein